MRRLGGSTELALGILRIKRARERGGPYGTDEGSSMHGHGVVCECAALQCGSNSVNFIVVDRLTDWRRCDVIAAPPSVAV